MGDTMSNTNIGPQNWFDELDQFDPPPQESSPNADYVAFIDSEPHTLTASMREHLSIEGQAAMRKYRDNLPDFSFHTVKNRR